MNWLTVIENDETRIDDFIKYYENELQDAKKELEIGSKIINESRKLPHIVDLRFSQLQEVEAVYELVDIWVKQVRSKYHRQYLTAYSQKLVSRDVERFVEGEPEYIDRLLLKNKVDLLRNKYASITKGLEFKHYQITNIVKLRAAGADDLLL